MGWRLPTGMYRGIDFDAKPPGYERRYRLATMAHQRNLRPKRGPYKPTTERMSWHQKPKPGPCRRPRRMWNSYVQFHES